MGPRGREQALGTLKATLVSRFGAASREVVEAEVEGRLAGRSKLERDDIDAIEHSVLSALKQKRGSTMRKSTRSAPDLTALSRAEPPAALHPKLQQTPAPPATNLGAAARRPPPGLRPSSAGSRLSAASAPRRNPNPRAPTLSQRPPAKSASEGRLHAEPPYGVTVVGLDNDDARSCVQCNPRRPVPAKPKMKPMDHWDLIVAFDNEKHRQEMHEYLSVGKAAAHARFRGTLDGQMVEVEAARQEARDNRRREAEELDARMEENRRVTAAEKAAEQAKVDMQNRMNTEMLASINARKQRELEKKQRDQDDIQRWLASEKERKEREHKEKCEEHHRKCEQARREMQEAMDEAARRKKEREANEKAYIAQQQANIDAQVKAGRDAVQARMDQIERNCATIGAEIANRDAKAEAALQASIKRVLEEQERRSKEEAERRKNNHERKVKEMLASLDEQMAQRAVDKIEEKKANDRQAKIWKEQYEEGLRQDQAKEEARRKAREDLDNSLIAQMSEAVSVHPRNFGITAQNQNIDVNMNRAIFEQMADEGFRHDMSLELLGKKKPQQTGKLDPFPSVGRFEGEIHEYEQMVPDVG